MNTPKKRETMIRRWFRWLPTPSPSAKDVPPMTTSSRIHIPDPERAAELERRRAALAYRPEHGFIRDLPKDRSHE